MTKADFSQGKDFIADLNADSFTKASNVWTSADISILSYGQLFLSVKALVLSSANVLIKAQKKCRDGTYINLTNLVYDSDNSRYTTQVSHVYYESTLSEGEELGPWNVDGSNSIRIVATFSDDTDADLQVELTGS